MTRQIDGDFEISGPYTRYHAPWGHVISTDEETFIKHLPTGHYCDVLRFPKKKKYQANSLVIQYSLDTFGRYADHADAIARAKEVLILQAQGIHVEHDREKEWKNK